MAWKEESERAHIRGFRDDTEVAIKVTPWGKVKLCIHKCVYEPSDDTDLILEVLKELKVNKVFTALDIGTGTGLIAKVLADNLGLPKVVASDISPYAIECAKLNLSSNVLVIRCDSASCFKERSFDLVILNPPYLPKEGEHINECEGWLERSWTIDKDSLEHLCKDALRASRKIFITIYSNLSPLDLAECVRSNGFKIIRTLSKKFFFEELRVIEAWRLSG